MSHPALQLVPDRPRGLRYTLRERVWHWTQGSILLLLPITGFVVHFPGPAGSALTFSRAVAWHLGLGILILANAGLGLLYYAVAGRWPRMLPAPGDFTGGALRLIRHYSVDVFRGEPHPFDGEGGTRLGILAKITYATLLLLIIPFQMATGVLIALGDRFYIRPIGFMGLPILGPAHTLGAYLFVAFLGLHVYLTTLGPDPWGRFLAMITGRSRPGGTTPPCHP